MNRAPATYSPHFNYTWMPLPPSFAICPPGLEYLSHLDWLLIHQKYEVLELITSFETANKYEVRNRLGEMVYFATEENNWCVRNCLGTLRPFTMVISNHVGQQVIHLVRPFRCDGCCCPCCLQELEIQAPPGLPIGFIQQVWHPLLPKFVIQNEAHKDVLKIVGPCITSACFGDVVFEVLALDEKTSVGRISKKWGGVLQEFFTDVDFLGISFPLDLDVKMKAVMLGAGFLLDFIFFEEVGEGGGRCSVWC
ncbi:phospholipid scramblase 1-like [Pantherophis guttatus]|uniref:Phospholipid scramblase n=1 Tax=Pantherophis guttatus TaxID=94885 RepID=A0A6P9D4X4_PANGU|nr:phospholipid scramblase 1-like [Pantherophis guttatus]